MAKIEKIVEILSQIKQEIVELENMRKQIESELIERLEQNGAERITVKTDDAEVTATIVRSTTLKFDEQGLASALPPAMWRQISTRVLDGKALEDKVARGAIDVDIVAQNSEEVARKPYVKLTSKGVQ